MISQFVKREISLTRGFLFFTQLILCLSFFYVSPVNAAENPVHLELIADETSPNKDQSFWIGLKFNMDENWHLYWKNPGDSGMAPSVSWALPEGVTIEEVVWPYPKRVEDNSIVSFVYGEDVTLLARVTPQRAFTDSAPLTIAVTVNWVACSNDNCQPGISNATLTLPLVEQAKKGEWHKLLNQAITLLPSKEGKMKVERNDTHLQFALTPSQAFPFPIEKAYFSPDNEGTVDIHTAAVMLPTDNDDILLTLKEENPGMASALKGVLVLQTKDNISYAYDVNLPITKSGPLTHLDLNLMWAIMLAFAGGIMLNLMPCVLPVISFKILSFAKIASHSRKAIMRHGFAFSAGVMISFWALASVMLVLRGYGNTVGWGFQLQEPIFVALLAAVILIFGLNLFGVFELGTSIAGTVGRAEQKANKKTEGLTSSFCSGILATAVATPCTGPFLGTAIGLAITLPAPLAMLIFTSLGLGMASPYLLLTGFPALIRYMPKPGQWMITFKEIMGFFMLATVLWLLWVFGAQTSIHAVFTVLCGFFVFSLGAWIYGTWGTPAKKRKTRWISYLITSGFLLVGSYIIYQASTFVHDDEALRHTSHSENRIAMADGERDLFPTIQEWIPFSPAKLEELRKRGIPVFIDFTAKWCLICQANHVVLTNSSIESKMADMGVVKMKADWTKKSEIITKELQKYGRNGVPLYLFYGQDPSKPPTILPQVLTPTNVLEHLEKESKSNEKVD